MTQFLQNLKTGKTKHHVICGYIHICMYKEITKKMEGMLNTKFQVVETRVGDRDLGKALWRGFRATSNFSFISWVMDKGCLFYC